MACADTHSSTITHRFIGHGRPGYRLIVLRYALTLMLVIASCSTAAPGPTAGDLAQQVAAEMDLLQTVDEPMRGSILSWFNTTGLARLSPGVWQTRLDQLCSAEFWNRPDFVEARAKEYLALDADLSMRDPEGGDIAERQVFTTVWVMALNHCRSLVPSAAVEAGPPWLNS